MRKEFVILGGIILAVIAAALAAVPQSSFDAMTDALARGIHPP